MTMNEYQKSAMRTASGVGGACDDNLILQGAMGLNGEAGEVIDILKKHLFQGHELDKRHMAMELGDCLWYLSICAQGLGYSLDEIGQMNKEKLEKRYPEGFEVDKSTNRLDGDI